jgi:putative ABC transport system permease protein
MLCRFQPMLALAVAAGRWFTAEEDAPGDSPVVVLSDGLWRRRFGGDAGVIGRTIRLNDRPHTVVGIIAASRDASSTSAMAPARRGWQSSTRRRLRSTGRGRAPSASA